METRLVLAYSIIAIVALAMLIGLIALSRHRRRKRLLRRGHQKFG